MKKIYLVPSVKFHSVKVRPIMQAVSPDAGFDNGTGTGGEDEAAKSIWDDTCGDGFNW